MNLLAQVPNLSPDQPGAPSLEDLMSGLKPIKPAVKLPVEAESFNYLLLLWVILGLLLLTMLAWLAWKKLGKKDTLTSEQNALASLDEITDQNLDNSEFVLKVSHVLKTYLEDKELFTAVRQTTEEFLESLRHSEKISDHRDSLKTFFEQCDLVKFAGGSLVGEQREELIDNVKTLVNEICQSENRSSENLNLTE